MRSIQVSATRVCRPEGLHRVDAPTRRWVDDHGLAVTAAGTLARLDGLRIPPAWREVWASPDPDARVQATGVDARGRTQYRYSAAAERQAAEHKFDDLLLFGRVVPALRARVDRHLAQLTDDTVEHRVKRATAAAVRLIDRGLFRVGSERYARDNHTYGLTTLTSRHVRVGTNEIEFTFVGKEHRPWHLTVQDRQVADIVRSLVAEVPDADTPVFSVVTEQGRHVIGSAAVNSYIHAATAAPATAKTLRTWGGTSAAAVMSAGAESPFVLRSRRPDLIAYDVAAHLLGNTREVARRSYVHPLALEAGRSATVVAAVEHASASATTRDVRALLGDDAVVVAVVGELDRLSVGNGRPSIRLG